MLLSKDTVKRNICAVGGRSGGHLIPCIHYIAQKKQLDPSINKTILFYTSNDLTTSLVARSSSVNCPIELNVPPVPYKKWYLIPWWTCKLLYSFLKSFFILLAMRPAEVMSSGGIESIPVCLAAHILRIPVILFELNAVPGKAILFLARFISRVHVCFKKTFSYFPRCTVSLASYPVRFTSQELAMTQHEALDHYLLDSSKKTIVILGGSQGSFSLNKIAVESIITFSQFYKNIQVIHQIGNDNFSTYKNLYQSHEIDGIVIPFEQKAHYLYSSADLIIARAGAGTLFEIAAFGKPACIIPLETPTTDHQKDNAQAFVEENPKTFSMFLQKDLEKSIDPLVERMKKILLQSSDLHT